MTTGNKWRTSKSGVPARCHAGEGAKPRACPRGGANDHYDTTEEARQGFEKKMNDKTRKIAERHLNVVKACIGATQGNAADLKRLKRDYTVSDDELRRAGQVVGEWALKNPKRQHSYDSAY